MSPVSTTRREEVNTASQLRGFGPLGIVSIILILAGSLAGPSAAAVLVLIWADLSGTSVRDLGFSRPRKLALTLVASATFGIALKLALKAVLMPLLGAPPLNVTYHFLAGNAAGLPGIVATVIVGAGFGEEVFFRAYLFERIGALLGRTMTALAVSVVISSALFAIAHYVDQGLPGVEQAAVTGLAFGGVFAWRRQIWITMVAHAAFDLTAIALIYFHLETVVAHMLFR
jgi:membrane protease YdiL (CAAX protease family)